MTILFALLLTLNLADPPKEKALYEAEFIQLAIDRHWSRIISI